MKADSLVMVNLIRRLFVTGSSSLCRKIWLSKLQTGSFS